jgi:hypothetical protein
VSSSMPAALTRSEEDRRALIRWAVDCADSPSVPTSVYLGPLVPPAAWHLRAPIAQQAERLHGKEKVCGSIPHGGSDSVSDAAAHRRNMRSIQTVTRPGNW